MPKKPISKNKKSDRELLEYIATTVAEHSVILAEHSAVLAGHSNKIGHMGAELIDIREELRDQRRVMRLLPDQIGEQIDRTYGPMLNDHEDRIRVLEKSR